MAEPTKRRTNEDNISSIASPMQSATYTDFSDEIELPFISGELWIFGQGDVQIKPALDEDYMPTFSTPALLDDDIFTTAKGISMIGTETTVSRITVWF